MKRLIVTTSWDDGQITDLRLAKLLTQHGIKGTFYITKTYGNPLGKQGVIEIDREHEIGAHTINHTNLLGVTCEKAREEIDGSKIYLEDILGHDVKMFCYPYGKYNHSIRKIINDGGFIGARTCSVKSFALPNDPFLLGITMLVSNYSPLSTLKACWKAQLLGHRILFDWEQRAKAIFSLFLKYGGVFHIYGHSKEIDKNNEWNKLESLFSYLSNREGVDYFTNGQVIHRMNTETLISSK